MDALNTSQQEQAEREQQQQPTPQRCNPESGPYIIQKYGGTSIGKFIECIADVIVPSFLDQGKRVALVCSARSGATKSTGTTNLLLRAAEEALQPLPSSSETHRSLLSAPATPPPSSSSAFSYSSSANGPALSALTKQFPETPDEPLSSSSSSSPPSRSSSSSPPCTPTPNNINITKPNHSATVDKIRDDHIEAARSIIKNSQILDDLEKQIMKDCDSLRNFLWATQIIFEISPRSKDIIIGMGEKLSCRVVTALLKDRGIASELVVLDNIVEEDQTLRETTSLGQSFYDRLSFKLGERLQECQERVPVVTGFFGVVPGSLLSQIGRGYTDLCAALCAVGIDASELQIWKEVDGIFTADPRKVPTARLLNIITPDEAAELTYYGSEVIHPFTMEQVIRAAIPIRIKNVENPTGHGTIIYPDSPSSTGTDTPPVVREERGKSDSLATTKSSSSSSSPAPATLHANGYHGPQQSRRIPTAVTIKDNILVLNIRSNRKTISHGFFAQIFGTLDRYGIVVDLIATSETSISMAIHGDINKSVRDRLLFDLSRLGEISIRKKMAILSLVGKHMKNMVGIAGKMFSVLAEGGINIEVISQGASEINTSCVIDEKDAVKALNLVHHHLLSISPAVINGPNGPWLF